MTRYLAFSALFVTVLHARPAAAEDAESKRPGTALALSAGATAASIALFATGAELGDRPAGTALMTAGILGVTFGPSAGHLYARGGLGLRTPGMAIRAVSAGVVAIGLVKMALQITENVVEGEDGDDGVGRSMVIGGLIGVGVGAAWDIVTAPHAAERANTERSLRFAPTVVRTSHGTTAPGVGVVGTF